MARENNQNKNLIRKSQNLLNLDIKRAAEKEATLENQSLKVQLKPIFNAFSSELLSPRTLLIIQDDSACSNTVIKKINITSELSHY
jgi:hypothetical protein